MSKKRQHQQRTKRRKKNRTIDTPNTLKMKQFALMFYSNVNYKRSVFCIHTCLTYYMHNDFNTLVSAHRDRDREAPHTISSKTHP